MLCLDLSEFPIATRESTGIEKVMLLKEILDRIELPPPEDIPDLAAVEVNFSGGNHSAQIEGGMGLGLVCGQREVRSVSHAAGIVFEYA